MHIHTGLKIKMYRQYEHEREEYALCKVVCVCVCVFDIGGIREIDLERLLSASHNTQPPTHQGTTTPATRPGQPHTTHQQALLRTTLCIITSITLCVVCGV